MFVLRVGWEAARKKVGTACGTPAAATTTTKKKKKLWLLHDSLTGNQRCPPPGQTEWEEQAVRLQEYHHHGRGERRLRTSTVWDTLQKRLLPQLATMRAVLHRIALEVPNQNDVRQASDPFAFFSHSSLYGTSRSTTMGRSLILPTADELAPSLTPRESEAAAPPGIVRLKQMPPRFKGLWFLRSVLAICGLTAARLVAPTTTTTTTTASSCSSSTSTPTAPSRQRHHQEAALHLLVIGSANADTFLPVERLPIEGENLALLPGTHPSLDVPGGKGCTQAVALARLLRLRRHHHDNNNNSEDEDGVSFVGQLGHDLAGQMVLQILQESGVNVTHCTRHRHLPTGHGYVFRTQSGSVSAIVSGGANRDGWWPIVDRSNGDDNHNHNNNNDDDNNNDIRRTLDLLLDECDGVLLQREVPEHVNAWVASKVAALRREQGRSRPVVFLDAGGEDRPIDVQMLQRCDYILPNESELRRLVQSFGDNDGDGVDNEKADTAPDDGERVVVALARKLQRHGARNVLVTRGRHGCTLLTETGDVLTQPAVKADRVVDETGAGDCFRAAFAVALLEGTLPLIDCLECACAAGACAVEVEGAAPSAPTRAKVESKLRQHHRRRATRDAEDTVLKIPRGDGLALPRGGGSVADAGEPRDDQPSNVDDSDDSNPFPFKIGSRLNSMKDRPELWPHSLESPRDYVARQARVKGLTCVDFNFPQHFHDWSPSEARAALDEHGLVAGAVCLRYPSTLARGAMNHPDPVLRRKAIDLTLQAADAARILGCDEVVVWSAYDGYDYPFQSDYDTQWDELVEAFRECCDAHPDIRWSLEYKPTDENTRFFTVPSTGAALLMVRDVDRANFGLTLDVGHMLMAGENPGQSVAMVGRARKLFGIQLNDGYTRLAAEDGLMFGSVHPAMALEIVHQLRRTQFRGHLYFDTFPQRSDPIREAEYNIRRVRAFWRAAGDLDPTLLHDAATHRDGVAALELIDKALRSL